jgi:hypothetical protein
MAEERRAAFADRLVSHRSAGAPDASQERALEFVHGSALQHVVLADRKAGILFTLLSAALLFLLTRIPVMVWPPKPLMIMWLVVVTLLLTATTLAFLVILPRVRVPKTPNVLFWGAIAKHPDADAYQRALCEVSSAELASGKAVHCFELSRICARKFQLLRAALLFAAAGLVLFLVMLGTNGV